MSALGLIALISGVLGVLLTIKQNIWCWPMALISVIVSLVEFYEQRLFGDMALQLLYLVAGVYGWYFWNKNKGIKFKVTVFDKKLLPLFIGITVIQGIVYYLALIYLKSDQPLLDAILTACSITATYMMTKKWIENWLFWVYIDAAYIFLYGIKDMWLFAILYAVFAAVAFYGWRKWKTIIV